jgi:dephospho-CoA kinase
VPALGITGGVATGKSIFTARLVQCLSAVPFDADQCAHELLAHDADVRRAVLATFGENAFDHDGKPDRAHLRETVFANSSKRRELERILHPAIRARWIELAKHAAGSDRWFCADIPLLYETNAETHFAAVIVVACSPATQRARLLEKRHLSTDLAEKIIAAQFDLTAKITRSDYLIWNDSSATSLDRQTRLLVAALQQRFHHG